MIVTVAILGVAFVVFLGGFGTAIFAADRHRKQAVVQASLRNFAEAVKSPTTPYVDCATPASYAQVFTPSPPTRESASAALPNGTSHAAPGIKVAGPSRVLAFYAASGSVWFTAASGLTELWDVRSGDAAAPAPVSAALDDQPVAARGDVPPAVGVTAPSAVSVVQTVVLPQSATASSIERRGTSNSTATASSTLTLSKPPNTVAGDAMVAQVVVRGGSATSVTAPNGWLLVSAHDNGTAVKSLVYERTATGPAASVYVWSFNSPVDAAGGVVSYSGVAKGYTASVDSIRYWNGSAYVAGSCTTDRGLQLIALRLRSDGGESVETLEIVKRKP